MYVAENEKGSIERNKRKGSIHKRGGEERGGEESSSSLQTKERRRAAAVATAAAAAGLIIRKQHIQIDCRSADMHIEIDVQLQAKRTSDAKAQMHMQLHAACSSERREQE